MIYKTHVQLSTVMPLQAFQCMYTAVTKNFMIHMIHRTVQIKKKGMFQTMRAWGSVVVKALRYKSAGPGTNSKR